MTEKRKSMRFTADVPMEYRLCRDRLIEGLTSIRDLSRGGMQFPIHRRLERGTLVNIKFILPEDERPVYLTGEVAWASGLSQKNSYEYFTGIKFFRIDNFDRVRLLDYAYNEWLKISRAC